MNIKLSINEIDALMRLLELDTCTDVAESNWEETTCAVSDLTKDQADNLYHKLFTAGVILHNRKTMAVIK
jgi:hypothetical protein